MKNKKNIRRVIGLNEGHDGGCTLVEDGKVIATMAEERLNRVKYSYGWLNSLKYCLEKTKTNLSGIDLVVFSDYSDKLKDGFEGGLSFFGFPKNKCIRVDHHLSHAYTTYYTSPFDKALVFVLDARGNNHSTESIYLANHGKIKKIGGNPIKNYEKGIVAAYQAFTAYFGWHQNNAGKTMGLSSYGDPEKYSRYEIYYKNKGGLFSNNLPNHTASGLEEFCRENKIEVPPRFCLEPLEYKHMAAWIQSEFERAVISTVKKFQEETGIENLCMGGGGALNTVCNSKILEKTGIKRLHVFPAAGDSGQSIGNALYGYYKYNEHRYEKVEWSNDYRSSNYTLEDYVKTLSVLKELTSLIVPRSQNFSFKKDPNIAKTTAKLIAEGNIVGWFQGGSEIGPRALGHRSILCDPRSQEMKDLLNRKVKHREPFRPFAGSVLFDRMTDFFDWDRESQFMLFVVPVKKEKAGLIPAITHVDGTCRIQTVTREQNPLYYDLILEFFNITGIPVLLNTSFNLAGDPIVETVGDAVKCFLATKMDYLVVGDYLVKKER